MTAWRTTICAAAAAAAVAFSLFGSASALAAAPAPLSESGSEASISSSRGSGVFGKWTVDEHGMPAYDYTLDEAVDPRAEQPELNGDTANWSQLGNDSIVANAYNHGYVQLWSSARMYQWANLYDAPSEHYAGGFGWLRLADGRAASTLYADRPSGSKFQRRFGVGYFRKQMRFAGLRVSETTTAPFGDDPVLVDEVKITNESDEVQRMAWWEYWDVNPYDVAGDVQRGLDAPRFDGDGLVTVAQTADQLDSDPLSLFLAAPDAKVSGVEADTESFFGSGSRKLPEAVASDEASGATAPPSGTGSPGRAMFATRSPVQLDPGESVTLRFVYGIAHPGEIDAIVERASRPARVAKASAREWARWLPSVDLGPRLSWLARELAWDAYMTRSSSLWEEECGHHVITQGGYYQYGLGQQIAFRDPLQHLLPMIYADPALARDVLIYSLQQQAPGTGKIEYGLGALCTPIDHGQSNDLDFWLIEAVSEYVLATRDLRFLEKRVDYLGGEGRGTVWEHLKLAVRHQESPPLGLGPNGNYLMGTNGDWSDFSTTFLPATESVLVTAQLAHAYPQLAGIARLKGDGAFAKRLTKLGDRNLEQVRGEWTDGGWLKRGYYEDEGVGVDAEYLEPQPWAILAGAAGADRAKKLVASIERFLQGRGAPAELGGPTRIGTSQSPAAADPEVSEFDSTNGVGDGNAVFVGGTWYALNGPLTWALGELDGELPGAAEKAFDELKRNTLAAHATAFPEHWSGVLHVDDACNSYYASAPEECGIALLLALADREYNGQVTHQPAWGLLSFLRLAGIEPVRRGYSFAPSLPLRKFAIRLPRVGIATEPGSMRGYLRTSSGAAVVLRLDPPGRLSRGRAKLFVDGERADARIRHGVATLKTRPGPDHVIDWAIKTKGASRGA